MQTDDTQGAGAERLEQHVILNTMDVVETIEWGAGDNKATGSTRIVGLPTAEPKRIDQQFEPRVTS
jgi:hypothetical protein